ncbi:MAG: ACP S-malonyltransferase, partial [Symbiobacteriaceae bacterium]
RGIYMQVAVALGTGGMAALMGLTTEQVDDLCARVVRETGLHVEGANYNCPGQIVVAGHTEAVERCMALAVEAGGRAVRLSVTAPFHSRLLAPAGERLAEALRGVTLREAQVPVVSNVTADYVTQPDEIRRLLIEQVSRPVLWEASIRRMIADGVDTFIEVGPSRTLTGFLRKIDKGVRALYVEDPASLGRVLDSLGRVC